MNGSWRWMCIGAALVPCAGLLPGCNLDSAVAPHQVTGVEAVMPVADDAPSVIEPAQPRHESLVRREIMLHAALYHAAFATRVDQAARFVVIEPAREDDPPDLGIAPEQFRALLLRELDSLRLPVAWLPTTWQTGGVDYFPDTRERATRLWFRIVARQPDGATANAEIGDLNGQSGGSRQTVTATWDGAGWNIVRDRVRVVW